MSIITIILVIVVVGLGVYLIETYVPMPPSIKTALRVVAVLGLGLFGYFMGSSR